MHDIVRLQLNGRMTMLSNCRATHTGMLSLTGAWLYAVSPSIIASRWKVEDRDESGVDGNVLQKSGAKRQFGRCREKGPEWNDSNGLRAD